MVEFKHYATEDSRDYEHSGTNGRNPEIERDPRNRNTDAKCRLCGQHDETVQYLLAGCERLVGAEYLRRHNNALMVPAVNWNST